MTAMRERGRAARVERLVWDALDTAMAAPTPARGKDRYLLTLMEAKSPVPNREWSVYRVGIPRAWAQMRKSWVSTEVAAWPWARVARSRRKMARSRGRRAKYVGRVAWSAMGK